jgi:urease accessory protein
VRLFLYITLRSLISSAVRLNVVGPLEAQAIQYRLGPVAGRLADRSVAYQLQDAAQTAPILELLQATQDRLYSRLFQS